VVVLLRAAAVAAGPQTLLQQTYQLSVAQAAVGELIILLPLRELLEQLLTLEDLLVLLDWRVEVLVD
jgi:hypothetical protein